MFTLGRRSLLAVILTVLLALVTPTAATSASMSALSDTAIRARLVYFLRAGRDTDRALALQTMADRSAFEAGLWREFLAAWDTANTAQVLNYTPPEGLPTSGHVFVVLGASLSRSGAITTQLTNRLKLAVKALAAYPHSRVLVTGGAPKNGHTEAERMREWLIGKGIAPARILTEDKASSTVSNATRSMAIMKDDPSITSYTLISDASHLRRAGVLFHAATLNIARKSGSAWNIRPLANIAYRNKTITNPPTDATMAVIASNVASVLGLPTTYGAVTDSPPEAAQLTGLEVEPLTKSFPVGGKLTRSDLSITAVYDQGNLDVTGLATWRGFSTKRVGTSTVTVSYADGGATQTTTYTVSVVKARTKAKVSLSTKKAKANRTKVKLTARLTSSTRVKVTGTVRIYIGSTLIKTITVKAAAKGIVRYTLPKFTKAGTKTITVKYSGSSTVKKVSSRSTLKVTKT